MTASSRGRVAVAALIAVLVFAAAFLVRKATAGGSHTPAQPAPLVLTSTSVHVSGVSLPASTLPALRHAPHASAPAASPASPASPSTAPAPAEPAAPAAPSTPSKSAAPSGGPVLVG
jgi:hypothetical protein